MCTFRSTCNLILFLLSSLYLCACGGGNGGNGGAALTPPTQNNTPVNSINLMGGSIQTGALSLSDLNGNINVSTYAGLIPESDGTVSTATLSAPVGIVSINTETDSYLYITDSTGEDIRQFDFNTGTLTTIAGTGNAGFANSTTNGLDAQFNNPQGIATDGTNLYVADAGNNRIRKIELSDGKYTVTTIAGDGQISTLNAPKAISTDGTNLYVTDTGNNRIVSIAISTGMITQLAGSPTFARGNTDSSDGTGATAAFNYPSGIFYDKNKQILYVADTLNNLIRSVDPVTGQTTTIAGNGTRASIDGTGISGTTAASFNAPIGIAANSTGTNLYVVDQNSYVVRNIDLSSMAVTTISGTAGKYAYTNNVSLTAATYYHPEGIAVAAGDDSKLYVADTLNNLIRQLNVVSNLVSTPIGKYAAVPFDDGTGTSAQFFSPNGIATDGTNLYVADSGSNTIRKIKLSTAQVTTLAGSGQPNHTDGQGANAAFSGPSAITTDGKYLYVADSSNQLIRRVEIDTGMVTTIAGTGTPTYLNSTSATSAGFNTPLGITYANGNLYIADTANNVIRKLNLANGAVTTFAGATPGSSGAPAISGKTDSTTSSNASFNYPHGITTDGSYLYVADTENSVIRKIDIVTGAVTTLAGNGTAGEVDNKTGTSAEFDLPTGITTDGTYLYVTDLAAIRRVDINSGAVTTIAGATNTGHTDGNVPQAYFTGPQAITTDGTNLYVCDTGNNSIRKIQ